MMDVNLSGDLLHRHVDWRCSASQHYMKQIGLMKAHCEKKLLSKQGELLAVGNYVSVKVPKKDRSLIAPSRLYAVIVEVQYSFLLQAMVG